MALEQLANIEASDSAQTEQLNKITAIVNGTVTEVVQEPATEEPATAVEPEAEA